MPMLRLPRLACSIRKLIWPVLSAPPTVSSPRCASPRVGCSTLITSAPQSASTAPADGTKVYSATSRTRTPSITRCMRRPPLRGGRILLRRASPAGRGRSAASPRLVDCRGRRMRLAARAHPAGQPRARAGLPEHRLSGAWFAAARAGAGRRRKRPRAPRRSIPRCSCARRPSAASTSSARSRGCARTCSRPRTRSSQLESGLRGLHTRADAVSAVAEARIALDRVSKSVPWRRERVAEARAKLEEADRQLASDHLGSAVFFASRAQRITDALRAETQQVAKWSDAARDPRRPREPALRALRVGERRRRARGRDAALSRARRCPTGRSCARRTAGSAGCTGRC